MKVDKQNRITIPAGMRKLNQAGGDVNVYLLGDWENNSEKVRVLITPNVHEEFAYIGKRNLDPKGRMSITLVFDFICDRNSKPEDYDVFVYMQNNEVYLLCKKLS